MEPEVAKVIRGLGIVLVAFSALMLVVTLGGMLWMDVPMLLTGIGMILYGHHKAKQLEG